MTSSHFTAVFDACVLYPAPIRDLLIRLAVSGAFRARWSAQIHDEWVRNLLANRPDLTQAQLDRTVALMNAAVEDSLVTGHAPLIEAIADLPDAGDRHVVAAAIKCGASVIVTSNLSDFPAKALAPWQLEAQHPDEFIGNLLDLCPAIVLQAVREARMALRHPPVGVDAYLGFLKRVGLVSTVGGLDRYRAIL